MSEMPRDIELLVSTFSALLHVTIDCSSFELKTCSSLHEGEGVYYGITWDKSRECYYVLARHYPEFTKKNKILVFDKEFACKRVMDAGGVLREAHQMRVVGDKLLVCNTNLNCITSVSLVDEALEHFYPFPASKDKNFNHINSISYHDGRIWLVAANRFRNSFFMCFNYPSWELQEMDAVGLSAHNIIEWRDYRVTCDSFHGSLVFTRKVDDYLEHHEEYPMHSLFLLPDVEAIELQTIAMYNCFFRERRGAPVFPRGLAITDDAAFVGLSEVTKRSMRNESLSRLMVIDGLSSVLRGGEAKNVSTILLGAYGAVMDVRVISERDYGNS